MPKILLGIPMSVVVFQANTGSLPSQSYRRQPVIQQLLLSKFEFTSSLQSSAHLFLVLKRHNSVTTMGGDLDLSDPAISETWNQVANSKGAKNWMALYYADGGKKIGVKASGSGGLKELAEVFEDDQVMFGFLRVGAEDRKAVTSTRCKSAMITWIGEGVGIMKKAKVGPQREEIISHLNGIQFFLAASERAEIDMMHMASELLRSGGAHKPTHYIFGPGQEVALTDIGSNFKSYV